jgi:hypothetical protein
MYDEKEPELMATFGQICKNLKSFVVNGGVNPSTITCVLVADGIERIMSNY